MKISNFFIIKVYKIKEVLILFFLILQIFSISLSQTSIGDLHYVSAKFQSPFSVYAVDMDNDGDNDIISGSSTDTIAWYRNDGSGLFTPAINISTELDNIRCVFGCDLDMDGDIDVLSASKNDNTIAWFENDGDENFGLPIIIANNASAARFVGGYDMDNDNDIDIVASYYAKIVWYENDGNCNFSSQQIISNSYSYRLCVSDINGDAYNDIFTYNINGESLIWYKNNGNKTFSEKTISLPASHENCYDIYVSDVNGNGQMDLIASFKVDNYYGEIAWFQNEGNDNLTYKDRITIKYGEFERITACDFDDDGDADVFSTRSHDRKLYWYRNDDLSFHSETITSNLSEYIDILNIDIDMDDDIDIVVSSSYGHKIVWIENLSMEILSQPECKIICPYENTSFSIKYKDATFYKWQVKKNDESYFCNIEDNETYHGAYTQELIILQPDLLMNGFQYRCYGTNGSTPLFSDTVTLSMYDDNEPPVLVVKNTNLYLSESIQTELNINDVIDSLYDNCSYVETILSRYIFDCSDIGENQIEITAIDGSGNIVIKTAMVNVIDTVSPIIQGFTDVVEFFTANSLYIIETDTCDPVLYYDNCYLASMSNNFSNTESLKHIEFPIGKTTVSWTATDNSGNTANYLCDIIVKNTNDYLVSVY
ncbi:MAG: FG-GAP-like repeat-containing protein [Bacteroidales bacterium]|nr:FG-GAP-like repeat-containing protein [Bacteroidales bacterium]